MDLVRGSTRRGHMTGSRRGFFVLPAETVLKTSNERRTNRYTRRVNVKRLASELAFTPGQTEPVMWCLADLNHPELSCKSEEKSGGGWRKGGDCRY